MNSIVRAAVAWLLSLICPAILTSQSSKDAWITLNRQDLCVTEGALREASGDRMSVDVPKMRAFSMEATASSAELRFTYLGPSKKVSPLGSGKVRNQIGLKLRAQDPCNLVYVMWRVSPVSELVVSVKRNPSEHASAECTNHGYTNIKPRRSSPIPHLKSGESHTLRAEMKQEEVRVFVDNHEVWFGEVGVDAARLEGPVGIRSDNVRLEFDFKARALTDKARSAPEPCKSGDSD